MFQTKLDIEAVSGENVYVLSEALVYVRTSGFVIVAPKGFETNFASVPKLAKIYIDDNDFTIRSPSVIHDFLYSKESKDYRLSRKDADKVLQEAMIGEGMRKSKAGLIYYTLRLFGRWNYEKR
mgnify:CR=1 FL=1